MTTCSFKGVAAAALLAAGLTLGSIQSASADQPTHALAAPAAKTEADNALRRGAAPPALAARTYCRDQAARMRLFGLGRHKFLQRCRRARRKALQPPAR